MVGLFAKIPGAKFVGNALGMRRLGEDTRPGGRATREHPKMVQEFIFREYGEVETFFAKTDGNLGDGEKNVALQNQITGEHEKIILTDANGHTSVLFDKRVTESLDQAVDRHTQALNQETLSKFMERWKSLMTGPEEAPTVSGTRNNAQLTRRDFAMPSQKNVEGIIRDRQDLSARDGIYYHQIS